MSVIEDTRKALQDFLAPEMRELKTRLDALDKRMDASEKRTDERHAETMEAIRAMGARIDRRVDSIIDFTELREKVAVLDAERRAREKVAS